MISLAVKVALRLAMLQLILMALGALLYSLGVVS
jgi:hypothetical protein